MKRLLLRALLGALLVVAIFAVLLPGRTAQAQLLSPGPMSKAHASIDGDAHCGDCHSSGKRVDQGACLKCHGDIGARLAAGKGLHGLQYRGKACEGCHVEHLGSGALLRWPGGDPSALDHSQTGWNLNGAHKTTPCRNCHKNGNMRGAPSFLGAPTTCVGCHKDPHENRFGGTCTGCHNEVDWKQLDLKTFNHDLSRYPLKGAHTTVACAKCHFEPPKYTGLKFQACADCHKDPHEGRLGPTCEDCHELTKWKPVTFSGAGAKHPGTSLGNGHAGVLCRTCHDKGNLVAPSKGSECVSCHAPVHQAPFGRKCASCHASILWVGLPRSIGLASHARTIYPLTGKHDAVACSACHKVEIRRDKRYTTLAFGRCADCHADKHSGEFAKNDKGECAPCHTTAGYRPTLFGAEAHSQTAFPLVGKHVASPCLSCHTAAAPRLDLHVTKQACADCHANPHGDQFAKEMAQGGCAHCHEANGWNLPKIDHSIWPLTGAHATTQCDSCHHATPEDKKLGRGASYRGVPRDCGGCHDDQHLGQFRLTQPVLECNKCHGTVAWKIPKFDHLARTGWALTGGHATTPCAGCHTMTQVQARQTVRWRGLSQDCRFCHANPHEGARASL